MRARCHCFATHSPCRHTGTGSVGSGCGQSCRGHRTALQVSPNAAWSSSTCAREATRFSHAGAQHCDGEVTGVWGRVVVVQSMSAVHSASDGDAVGAASWAGAGAGAGAVGAGPPVPRSPHAMTRRRTIELEREKGEAVTQRSMPPDATGPERINDGARSAERS
jgi:hypothetical protein